MTHVFISYSHEDDGFMRQMREHLQVAGIEVWTDESYLGPGKGAFDRTIQEAIEQAICLIAILSPDYRDSKWCGLEHGYADTIGLTILPVLLRGDERTAVPIALIRTTWIDARADARQALDLLTAEVLRLLEAEQPETANLPGKLIHNGKEFVYIPAGRFTMGSRQPLVDKLNQADNSTAFSPEHPQHEVALPGYYISQHPVTQAEYQMFVRDTGHRVPFRNDAMSSSYCWDRQTSSFPEGKDSHPVVLVSWHDAQAYCRWFGARLPSEAEWEKAARGNDMREWPWGNTWQDGLCNTAESGLQETSPVGQFSPQGDSPYGLADMAGNVWEWCSSLLAPFPYAATDGREDSLAAGERVLRGGAIGLSRVKARCAFRTGAQPEEYGFTIGFRIVMASPPESQRGDT